MYYKILCRQLLATDTDHADPCLLSCSITCEFIKAILRFVHCDAGVSLYSRITIAVLRGHYVDCIFHVPLSEHFTRNLIFAFYEKTACMKWCYHDTNKVILRSASFDRQDYTVTWTLKAGSLPTL